MIEGKNLRKVMGRDDEKKVDSFLVGSNQGSFVEKEQSKQTKV